MINIYKSNKEGDSYCLVIISTINSQSAPVLVGIDCKSSCSLLTEFHFLSVRCMLVTAVTAARDSGDDEQHDQ